MERRVMFTDLEEVGFDEHSVRIPVTELHLDQREVAALQKKKEQVVNRQQKEIKLLETRADQDDEPETAATADSIGKKKNKKKSKRNKTKGLASFMEAEELEEFNKGTAAEK
mmetsp:Transcript_11119/g.14978  ORF Transcript_11119/g.14978 Transcript_11119/m.14978 type:complete len:112 (+) Transcript_11119:1006-1341(+)